MSVAVNTAVGAAISGPSDPELHALIDANCKCTADCAELLTWIDGAEGLLMEVTPTVRSWPFRDHRA